MKTLVPYPLTLSPRHHRWRIILQWRFINGGSAAAVGALRKNLRGKRIGMTNLNIIILLANIGINRYFII